MLQSTYVRPEPIGATYDFLFRLLILGAFGSEALTVAYSCMHGSENGPAVLLFPASDASTGIDNYV